MGDADKPKSEHDYQIAAFGDRLFAYLIDFAINIGAASIIWMLIGSIWLTLEGGYLKPDDPVEAVILSFLILFMKPIFLSLGVVAGIVFNLFFEIGMHGQTFGKRARNIRVLKSDGSPPNIRNNLLRWVFLPLDILSVGMVPLLTINGIKGRRLGDLAAGTFVVRLPQHEVRGHRIAPVKERFLAYSIDWGIIIGLHIVIWPIVLAHVNLAFRVPCAVLFLTVAFYDFLFNIGMQGQTPGKKTYNLKVLKLDGSSAKFKDYLFLWVMRPFDRLFVFKILKNPNGRGLSDIAAGTIVTKTEPKISEKVIEPAMQDKPEAPGPLIENIAEASRNARSIYFLYSGLLAYCALTVFGTSDRRIILNEPANLPVLNIDVSLNGFFILAPILSIFMFIYFQIYLNKLKRLIENLRSNYRPLKEDEHLYPWMINFADELGAGFVARTQRFIVKFSLWWSVPAVLMLLALWYLKKHDPNVGSIVGIMPLLGALIVIAFWVHYEQPAEYSFKINRAQMKFLLKSNKNKLALAGIVLVFEIYFFAVFMPYALRGESILGNWPLVDLSHQNLVSQEDEEYRTLYWVNLRNANLQGANFTGAILQQADLRGADLQKATFADAHLPDADLSDGTLDRADLPKAELEGAEFIRPTDLSGAILHGANLQAAKLRGANLIKANLINAKLGETDLRGVTAENADFRLADLRSANLYKAVLNGADLSNAKLERANLQEAKLSRAKFFGADLSYTNFQKANLFKANVKDAENLHLADLSGADLHDADLQGADLHGANLVRTNLRKANLSEANLDGANLANTNLKNAKLFSTNVKDAENLHLADLRGADFHETNLMGADLHGAKLDGADLKNANLQMANLQGAHLSKANLDGADLENTNLQNADLIGTNVKDAENLRLADLQGANFRGVNLQGADLRDANLQGVHLREANLDGADLEDTNLQNADLIGTNVKDAKNLRLADLQGANFRGVNLQGADLRDANLESSILFEADLSNADLSNAQLQNAVLRGAQFNGAILDGTKLDGADLRWADLKSIKIGNLQNQVSNPLKSNELRSNPLDNLTEDAVISMIEEKGFFDDGLNETGTGFPNKFEKQLIGKVIIDHNSGLTWQQSTSDTISGGVFRNISARHYNEVQAYINKLNKEKFAGFSDWRLPTLEEAMSLMQPEMGKNGLYVVPPFDSESEALILWTSDKDSPNGNVWFVDFEAGECLVTNIISPMVVVRAVRSGT